MTETVTKADLARRLGITKARVSQLVSKGLPVRGDGRIDLDAALNWLTVYSRPAVNRAAGTLAGAERLKRAKESGLPEHFAFALDLQPADRAAVLACLSLAYAAPAIACMSAIEAGTPVEAAKAMYHPLVMATFEQAGDILRAMGCEPFASDDDPPVLDTDALWQVAWDKISSPKSTR